MQELSLMVIDEGQQYGTDREIAVIIFSVHLYGLIKAYFKLPKELEMLSSGVVTCNYTQQIRNSVCPSRGVHVRKMRWTTAPCLTSTSGYPGERKVVEPFCLSQ